MRPAIEPGDWLLVDPTTRRWPRRGSVVVFREPFTDLLAIKRVAARPGDWVPFADGWLQLGEDEAWLLGDATDEDLAAAGLGAARDSRRFGPVPVASLAGRAWFRYGPLQRLGMIAGGPADLLERGRSSAMPVPLRAAPGGAVATGRGAGGDAGAAAATADGTTGGAAATATERTTGGAGTADAAAGAATVDTPDGGAPAIG